MREMKESGVTWVGKIPSTWEMKTIKQLMIERIEKNKDLEVNTILSLSAKDGVTLYNADNHSGNKPREDLSDYKIVRENDIVVNSMNILSGSVGLSSYTGVVSPVYYIYYPREDGNVEFFHYIFQCFEFQRSLRGLGNGILIKETESGGLNTIRMRIPSQKLGAQELPYCSRTEQDKIVAALEASAKKVDTLIANQEAQIEKLKAYKQSLITEVVTKGLDPDVPMKDSGVDWVKNIPSNWDMVYPKALFAQRKDRAFPTDEQLTASQQYGIMNQQEYMRVTGSRVVVVEKDFSILKHVSKGDFVISMRSFQGGLEYSEVEGCISSAYVMLKPNSEKVFPKYYRWLLKSSLYINSLQSTSDLIRDGQAMRFANFIKIWLPCPPFEEQQQIASYLDDVCPKIDSLIAIKQSKIEKLNQYKKSLIYEYVTGKKEVIC